MKDAMGPDAVSRNHSRAPPCSPSAVVTRRKNASIRTSMNRAFPTRERRCRAKKSPSRVSTSAGGGPPRGRAPRGPPPRPPHLPAGPRRGVPPPGGHGRAPPAGDGDPPGRAPGGGRGPPPRPLGPPPAGALGGRVGGEPPRPPARPGPGGEGGARAPPRHEAVPRGSAHRLEAVDDVGLHGSSNAPDASPDSGAAASVSPASPSLSASSIADSKSSPRSSPSSRPIFFMNRAALAGSFSSRSPRSAESASDSRRASSDFTVVKRDITRLKPDP